MGQYCQYKIKKNVPTCYRNLHIFIKYLKNGKNVFTKLFGYLSCLNIKWLFMLLSSFSEAKIQQIDTC